MEVCYWLPFFKRLSSLRILASKDFLASASSSNLCKASASLASTSFPPDESVGLALPGRGGEAVPLLLASKPDPPSREKIQ